MSCRFPGARNYNEFWQNIVNNVNSVTEIPSDRWNWRDVYGVADEENKSVSKWGGFIRNADKFDASFFRISPKEAEWMDPQQRIMLELSWSCIEDAGYSPSSLDGSPVGVFVGACNFDYKDLQDKYASNLEGHAASGIYNTMIPNRISHYFNFTGPSILVDTACSSSLVAIHQAVQAIRQGDCNLALAGGVSILCSPTSYITFSKMGMLSPTGSCKTFDEAADGYVRGEGGGFIVLKALSQAISDGDNIYGVIKSTALNHGGRARTLTSPSVFAQSRLIIDACQQGNISPDSIEYIETHGTGTPLGDPIEIQGLKRAFKKLYAERNLSEQKSYCGLGTVKTQIGHLESAAGIAGMIKLLLAIKHKTLPSINHFNKLNPRIDLSDSPFYIAQKNRRWSGKKSIDGRPMPRRAGVSSFGFGGSNAHLIVEEYVGKKSKKIQKKLDSETAQLVPFSAKTYEQLTKLVNDFNNFFKAESLSNSLSVSKFEDIVYTLQVGRASLNARIVFLAKDKPELCELIESFCNSNIDESRTILARETGNSQSQATPDLIPVDGVKDHSTLDVNQTKLIALNWVGGQEIDWQKLNEGYHAKRIALPTYPFALKRHWLADLETHSKSSIIAHRSLQSLHPLVHANTSNIEQIKFTSVFSGQEFFLTDHVVGGEKVFPAAAYMEMLHEALSLSMVSNKVGSANGNVSNSIIALKDLTWLKRLSVGDAAVSVEIVLESQTKGEIGFKIFSRANSADSLATLNCQGYAKLRVNVQPKLHSIHSFQSEFVEVVFGKDVFYKVLQDIGLSYGPMFRCVDAIYFNDCLNHERATLARLELPPIIDSDLEQYTFHPSIIDAALQSGLALISEKLIKNHKADSSNLLLPYSIGSIELHSVYGPISWAHARYGDRSQKSLDIDCYTEHGDLCISMKSVLFKPNTTGSTLKSLDLSERYMSLVPQWDMELPIFERHGPTSNSVVIVGGEKSSQSILQQYYADSVVVDFNSLCNFNDLNKQLGHRKIHHIVILGFGNLPMASENGDFTQLASAQHALLLHIFRFIKNIIAMGYDTKELSWTFVTVCALVYEKASIINPDQAGLHGLAGSLAKEMPHWRVRLCDLEDGDLNQVVSELEALPYDPKGNSWLYRKGQWFRQKCIEVADFTDNANSNFAYRKEGVYVVIGGAGGIGEVWTEYVITHYKAQVVWIGRSKINAHIAEKLDRMEMYGNRPQYISADAADITELRCAYEKIKADYGNIHGVIHSAITLNDKSLIRIDEEGFFGGLISKVDVSVCMAQVFGADVSLDFMLFFSSLQSFSKPAGQSSYVAGCSFGDSFAAYARSFIHCPIKIVNWGYWGDTGIVSSESYRARMFKYGLGSIESDRAMKLLEVLLMSQIDQIIFLKIVGDEFFSYLEIDENQKIALLPGTKTNYLDKLKHRVQDEVKLARLAEISKHEKNREYR